MRSVYSDPLPFSKNIRLLGFLLFSAAQGRPLAQQHDCHDAIPQKPQHKEEAVEDGQEGAVEVEAEVLWAGWGSTAEVGLIFSVVIGRVFQEVGKFRGLELLAFTHLRREGGHRACEGLGSYSFE